MYGYDRGLENNPIVLIQEKSIKNGWVGQEAGRTVDQEAGQYKRGPR